MSDIQDDKQNDNQNKKKKNYFKAREDAKLTLRKQKLDNRLRVKRELLVDSNTDAKHLEINPLKLNLTNVSEIKIDSVKDVSLILNTILNSSNIEEVKYCIFLLRQYITNSKYEIEDLLKTNIVNVIQSSLRKNINDNSIIYEYLWILINLSFSINIKEFVNFLLSNSWFAIWESIIKKEDNYLTLNLLWLLNNLSLTDVTLTYLIFEKDFFSLHLIPLLMKQNIDKSILHYGFSIIALGIKYIVQPQYQPLHEIITKLMCEYHMISKELSLDAVICLAHLSNIEKVNIIKEIFTCGILRRIVRREIDIQDQQRLALQLIGNILANVDENLIDIIVTKELVNYLRECIITGQDSETRKDACWCLSNLCLGTSEQIRCVIDGNLIPLFANILKEDKLIAALEALYCINNLLSRGAIDIPLILNTVNIIELLVETINKYESVANIITVCLESLDVMFTAGNKINQFTNHSNMFLNIFENKGGKELLSKLTQYKNQEVYDTTMNIIQKYYNSA